MSNSFQSNKAFLQRMCRVSWQVGKRSKILHINFHIGLFEQVHSASKLTIIKAYDFFSLYVEIVLGRPKNMANIHIFGLAILVKECSKGFDIYVTFFVACIVYPELQILYTSLKMELYQQKNQFYNFENVTLLKMR